MCFLPWREACFSWYLIPNDFPTLMILCGCYDCYGLSPPVVRHNRISPCRILESLWLSRMHVRLRFPKVQKLFDFISKFFWILFPWSEKNLGIQLIQMWCCEYLFKPWKNCCWLLQDTSWWWLVECCPAGIWQQEMKRPHKWHEWSSTGSSMHAAPTHETWYIPTLGLFGCRTRFKNDLLVLVFTASTSETPTKSQKADWTHMTPNDAQWPW